MRFQRFPARSPNREWTNRRIAAAKRAIEKEKAKLGMFVDQFPVETLEERKARLDKGDAAWLIGFRQYRYKDWRRVRGILFALPAEQRHALVEEWNNHRWLPGTPDYLLDFLRGKGVDVGH
jgi:hypothetical protein